MAFVVCCCLSTSFCVSLALLSQPHPQTFSSPNRIEPSEPSHIFLHIFRGTCHRLSMEAEKKVESS